MEDEKKKKAYDVSGLSFIVVSVLFSIIIHIFKYYLNQIHIIKQKDKHSPKTTTISTNSFQSDTKLTKIYKVIYIKTINYKYRTIERVVIYKKSQF